MVALLKCSGRCDGDAWRQAEEQDRCDIGKSECEYQWSGATVTLAVCTLGDVAGSRPAMASMRRPRMTWSIVITFEGQNAPPSPEHLFALRINDKLRVWDGVAQLSNDRLFRGQLTIRVTRGHDQGSIIKGRLSRQGCPCRTRPTFPATASA